MADEAHIAEMLTKREGEVARAYAEGGSYKEIARALGISPTTVRSHLRTVYGKLGVTSKIALAQTLADPGAPAAAHEGDAPGLAADLALELDEAMRRERMMARVLRIISQKGGQLDAVIDEVLDQALEICEAEFGVLFACHGDGKFSEMRSRNIAPGFARWLNEQGVFEADSGTGIGRVAATLAPINIADVRAEDAYRNESPLRRATADLGKARSFAAIPMMSGERLIGVFTVYRTRVHPFNDRAIELAQAFADQAAIAIENVRQITALEARLAAAAATREVLEAISAARDDEAPVLDAILRNARVLCDAPFAALALGREGDDHQVMVAHHGAVQNTIDLYREGGVPMDPARSFAARAICEKRVVHLANMRDTPEYRAGVPNVVALCDVQGIRTNLFVPLIADGEGIGCFIIFRHEVAPFSDEQIELVKTFAAQAVIALQNVRQFSALQARLDRAAATREVLEAIGRARDDARPVFDVILRNAQRLCKATTAGLVLGRAGDETQRLVAHTGAIDDTVGVYRGGGFPMDPAKSFGARAIVEKRVIHLHDMADTDEYRAGVAGIAALVDNQGIRTNLLVPLIADGEGIGCLALFRDEVSPYSEDQIELVETFAAQAAIALENVRRFRALEARLDREAATREILHAISRSRGDDAPVFDLILQRAAELCGADAAALVLGREGDARQRLAAAHGVDPATRAYYDEGRVSMNPRMGNAARAIVSGAPVHVEDMALTDVYLSGDGPVRSLVDDTGMRTSLFVPLMTAAGGIGALVLFRKAVRPYAADEIALVETFAAQAVIAVENVEQFKALESLNAELGDRVDAQVGEIERMGRLKQFLSPAVADAFVSSDDERRLTSHRALIATLFCDIRGFTAFCETAEPEETIEVLQAYHEQMGELISAHGGGVDKRMGDGIMVIFNDPLPCDDPAGDAVRLALAMRARMGELCAKWRKLGHRLGFGVGVSLGYATVGMVGSAGRFDYTASGTSVNTAARLCDLAADGEILLSTRAWVAVEGQVRAESRGEVEIKGIREPVEVFAVADEV